MVDLKNISIEELPALIQKNKTLLYGTGKYIDEFTKRYPGISIEKNISAFIETIPNKTYKNLNNTKIKIYGLEELKKDIHEYIIIIASSIHYPEILEILDALTYCDGLKVYILSFIENTSKETKNVQLIEENSQKEYIIPPIIHYCWFGEKSLPLEYQQYIDGWREKCPEYEIKCWDEKNYDINVNPFVEAMYHQKKWAFVSDYVRLDILYKYGGIYLDTDVELIKSLDPLRKYNGFIGRERANLVASGLGIGARKKNPIIFSILQKYNILLQEGSCDLGQISCPYIETGIFNEFGMSSKNETQIIDDFLILSSSYFGGMNRGTFLINPQDNTYSIHHYAGTWVDRTDKRKDVAAVLCKRCGII